MFFRRHSSLRYASHVFEDYDKDPVRRRPYNHPCRDARYGAVCMRPIQ